MIPSKLLCLLLLVGLSTGCGGPEKGGRPAGQGDLEHLKKEMTTTFAALEMYAHDHSLAYPDRLDALLPKYLDRLPHDPLDGRPLGYQKIEQGYRIAAAADYTSAGAERGYPQMDHFGDFALRAADLERDEIQP